MEDGEIVAVALRGAESPDVGGEPAREPCQRRAGAMVDICRLLLDHHREAGQPDHDDRDHDANVSGGESGTGGGGGSGAGGRSKPCRGRHRPHLNVVCALDAPDDPNGHLRLLDRTPLDPVTSQRLLCDAGVHRYVTQARSVIVDYSTTQRSVSDALFNALVVRDRGCRFPGCDRPPEWTEAHHLVPAVAAGVEP